MSDFESLVRAMVKNGAKSEDIAKQTADILNSINQEKTEKENKQNLREATILRFKEQVKRSYNENNLSIDDAAAFCVVVCASLYPNWDKKELEEFFHSIRADIRASASVIGKNPSQVLADLFNELREAINIDDIKKTKDTSANKREDKAEPSKKTAEPAGKSRSFTTSCKGSMTLTTPEERLLKFLDSL